jgi:hypothetical protein
MYAMVLTDLLSEREKLCVEEFPLAAANHAIAKRGVGGLKGTALLVH